uniref:Microtubule-actin cross-linking factor 1, isoforms 1/2/3/5 n=1 Tax=Sphaerodactylus townsendi TaxID=933632 RepID=A0ACB8FR18_9SAUR
MSSSDEETLSERSYRSERSCKSERSYRSERSGSLSPCPPGDTLPWNLPLHEQKKRKSQDSVLDPAERAVVRVAGLIQHFYSVLKCYKPWKCPKS